MIKEKWTAIIAAVLGLIFVFRGYFGKKRESNILDKFGDELQSRVDEKGKEAMESAKKKHSDTVDSSVDDWLDDELGTD